MNEEAGWWAPSEPPRQEEKVRTTQRRVGAAPFAAAVAAAAVIVASLAIAVQSESAIETRKTICDSEYVSLAESVANHRPAELTGRYRVIDGDIQAVDERCVTTVEALAAPQDQREEPDDDETGNGPEPGDYCDLLSRAVAQLVAMGAGDVDASPDGFHRAADLLREASNEAEGRPGDDLDVLASTVDELADVFAALDRARAEATDEDRAAIEGLIAAFPTFGPLFGSREALVSQLPDVVRPCDVAPDPDDFPSRMLALMIAHDQFISTESAGRSEFTILQEMDLGMSNSRDGASSDLVTEFRNCRADRSAFQFGDNSDCDVLVQSCTGGDLLACNDLYMASLIGSDYERMGATCGRRVGYGDPGFGGYCEESADE